MFKINLSIALRLSLTQLINLTTTKQAVMTVKCSNDDFTASVDCFVCSPVGQAVLESNVQRANLYDGLYYVIKVNFDRGLPLELQYSIVKEGNYDVPCVESIYYVNQTNGLTVTFANANTTLYFLVDQVLCMILWKD